MAKKEYLYKCFVEYPDGRSEPLDNLSLSEKERLAQLWGQRMAETLAQYYSFHPEEYDKI